MEAKTWLEQEIDALREDFDYRLLDLEWDVTDAIAERMEDRGVTKAELARRLSVSRAAITRLLRYGSNLTLKRLLQIAESLDTKVEIRLIDAAAAADSREDAFFGRSETMPYDPDHFAGFEGRAVRADGYDTFVSHEWRDHDDAFLAA